ncbi:MAG: T9SS type A sorting domain-containing protein [Cytophagales bacterium]|nr:T9SS type A sorting domain-containing protein [Cytophagales bacterium]
MKKSLLSIPIAGLITLAHAQIILDSTDIAGVNTIIVQATDTIPPVGLSTGPAGAAQTWDLSALETDIFSVLNFEDPASLPNFSDFPNSNLSLRQSTSTVSVFLKKSVDGLFVQGFAGDIFNSGDTISVPFNPVQTVLKFPYTYQDSFWDISRFVLTFDVDIITAGYDSIRINHTSIKKDTADGYGTVITPLDTFSCLRLYDVTMDYDTIYGLNPIFGWLLIPPTPGVLDENPILDTTRTYSWLAKGVGYSLVDIDVDGAGNIIETSYLRVRPGAMVAYIPSYSMSCCCDTCLCICGVSATVGVEVAGGVPPYTYLWDDSLAQDSSTATGLCAGGTYTVRVIDSANIDTAYATVVIIEPPLLITDSIYATPDTAGGNNGTATISVSGGMLPYTYQWSSGDTTANISGLAAGTYFVTITDANGCTLADSVTVGSVTSINEPLTLSSHIKLYPNPTTGILYIEMPKIGNATIFVLNLLGEIVAQMDNVNDFASLNLGELVEGTYFIKIQTSKQLFTSKLSLIR